MDLPVASLDKASLAALAEASSAINSSLDLDTVLNAIALSAAHVLKAGASSVLLLNKRREKLIFVAAVGDKGEALLGEEFDANLGIAGDVLRTGKPQLVGDVTEDGRFFSGIDDISSYTTESIAAAPMTRKGEVIGVIEVLNPEHNGSFTQIDIDLLQVFANLAAAGAYNARAHQTLQRENQGLREVVQRADTVIGNSQSLKQVMKLCDRVATSNTTALILGETGTGKEVTARYIHAQSQRTGRAFIGLNCAALSETLLESELFGHEKGAFTGATAKKIGRFELADGGTLFMDEIGDISASTQVKLLRVLEEREFVRVGGVRAVSCDVRIIAATNRDLKAAVAEGSFREDLFYRLNVFPIDLPPLRQRREDIPLLIDHFVKAACTEMKLKPLAVSQEAVASLTAHNWPGNIRELRNVIERAAIMCDGFEITPEHLPRELTGDPAESVSQQGDSSLWDYERAMIIKALTEASWNQSKAARELGISRDNLRYRVKKYKIQKP